MVCETILNIPGLVEAARDQRFDSILRDGSPERSNTRVPASAKFDVRRQAGIDQTLGIGDRPFVELSDPGRQCLDVSVQFSIGERTVDIAVGFGLFPREVFRAQEYLKSTVSADELWQAGHRASASDHAYADLPLGDDRFFAAHKAHVAGEGDL